MKLYLIERTSEFDYDQTRGMVIAANSEEEAISFWNKKVHDYTGTNYYIITFIAGECIYTETTIVLEDYNAG